RSELRNRLRSRFVRHKFKVSAEIVCQSKSIPCRVTDISRGGMYIEVAHPPVVGSIFIVLLALNKPLRLNCVVRRVVPGSGVGVTFWVGPQERKRFEALMLALALGSEPAAAAAEVSPPVRSAAMVSVATA